MNKKLIIAILCVQVLCPLHAQVHISVSDDCYVSSADTLAFWARSNTHGTVPMGNSNVLRANLEEFWQSANGNWNLKAVENVVLTTPFKGTAQVIPDELYASASYKCLKLDVGFKAKETDFNGLSVSGGDVTYSGNARTMPGYSFQITPVAVPFTKNKLFFNLTYGDYFLNDTRYIRGAMVHNTELFLRYDFSKHWSAKIGLEDWGMWGGEGKPGGFENYLRIVTGARGGDDASRSDQINILGNHLGRTYVRVQYNADKWSLSLTKDTMHEDGSGMRWQNFPDGVWTLHLDRKDKDAWVSDVVAEFIYSKCQSGQYHDRPATEEEKAQQDPDSWHYGKVVIGGGDNYFNHGEYCSGWTYFGRTIGIPLFTPKQPDENGITMGVINNRISGFNIGVGGKIAHISPYRFLVTYTRNFGTWSNIYSDPGLKQLSIALTGEAPGFREIPLSITYGLYADYGSIYNKCVTFKIGIRYDIL